MYWHEYCRFYVLYNKYIEGGFALIQFKNVSKAYKGQDYVLKNLNLTIEDGEFVFIVGESGAGKTTLTKLLLREEKVTSGKLHINQFKLEKLRNFRIPYYRRELGYVFQDFKLLPNKTVYENLAFALEIVGAPKKEIKKRVPYFLEMVELGDKANAFPQELSGGEKQRVCLARALINKPKIIVADEPTGNLDPELSYGIMNLLLRINKVVGRTVIVVTHEHELVKHFGQRVITISKGSVIDDVPAGGVSDAQEL